MRRRDLYDNLRIVQIYPFSLTKGNKIKAEKDKVAAFRASIRLELTRACAHGIIRGSDNIRRATVHTLFLAWLQYLQWIATCFWETFRDRKGPCPSV